MSVPSPVATAEASAAPPPAPPPASEPPAASARAGLVARSVAALGGLGWFLLFLGGARVVPPSNIEWMMRDDWAGHLFGWLFYRNAPWGWPLTLTPNHFRPYGTTVALNDGNPLWAVVLKPFEGLLSPDFQYTGLWLALCFALMGWFGARLVECVSPRPVHQALGGLLFALSPPLVARFLHPTLCAHWLVVAMLWLALRPLPDRDAAKRTVLLALLFNALGSGTHPYLVAMLVPLALALFTRLVLERLLTWWQALVAAAVVVGVDVLLFAALGYFHGASLGAEGFGEFAADLSTLFNSQGWSRLVPGMRATWRQHEGFAFLGVGVWGLWAAGLLVAVPFLRPRRDIPWRRVLPLGVVALGMAVYALSWRVAWKTEQVLDVGWLYTSVPQLTSAFRASGRFIWPLTYLLMLGAVGLWLWRWRARPWVGTAALVVAVGASAADLRTEKSALFLPTHLRRLQEPEWERLEAGGYRNLMLFPPHIQWVCPYDEQLVNTLSYFAYRHRLTFNSGNASRLPPTVSEDCHMTMRPGGVDPDTVYVVAPRELPAFLRAGARCGVLEGMPVCVAGQRADGFAQALEQHPLR
ncbi:DUF6311 domain-containing protein [Myxococcus sp. K15C18031901]|uniref:DUF6311 domain-containing protein n=1 Tax=Myxococcus dinghuensis TaxID=2906761 RepID=UPI0020A75C33|nr:DUF6311 domain-containing protein [Myxococcus dinghuensis]MCP3100691.1 DUF6311 domain-containing protein [Myxococcus dinghuensis]